MTDSVADAPIITWHRTAIRYGQLEPGDRIHTGVAGHVVTYVGEHYDDGFGDLTILTTDFDPLGSTYRAADQVDALVPNRPVDGYGLTAGDQPGACQCLYRRPKGDDGWQRLLFAADCPARCEEQRRAVVRAAFGA